MSLNLYKNASSRRRCSFKKAVLNIFAKSKEKHLYWSLFFNKVAGPGYIFIGKETSAHMFFWRRF